MKNLIAIFAALILAFNFSGCTSKEANSVDAETAELDGLDGLGDPSAEATVAEGEAAPPAAIDGEAAPTAADSLDLAADPFADGATPKSETASAEPADPNLDLEATDPALSPTPDVATELAAADPSATPAATEAPAPTIDPLASEPPPSDLNASADPLAAPADPMASSEAPSSTDLSAASAPTPTEEVAPAPKATLKKIDVSPRMVKGVPLNTVYIARSGDTLSSISNKIYAANKTKELKKYNTYLKGRDLKVGDKVYYNSPNRPDDATSVITYFDDIKEPAKTFVVESDKNIKEIAKELLGSKENWKELWATNSVESKDMVPAGTEIKYWPRDISSMATPVAAVAATPEPIKAPEPQAPVAAAPEVAPPPPADLPPPPPVEPPAMAANEPPPPPPPREPPPPPPSATQAKTKTVADGAGEEGAEGDSESLGTVELLSAAAIAMSLVAFFIIRSRKNKKASEDFMSETQIGT